MTSLYGTDPSYDYRTMYNIKDLRGPLPKSVIYQNTLLGALVNNPQCTQFTDMVKSLPDFAARYNNSQADFTIFVPIDGSICINSNDSYKVRQFITLHSLEHALPYSFFTSAGAMYVNSRLSGTRILVENLRGCGAPPVLDRLAQIIGEEIVGNAVIYYIDQSLVLDENPLSNY